MTDNPQKTFQALLKIHAHKEQKLRLKLSIVEKETLAIDEKKALHTDERQNTWAQMRTATLSDTRIVAKEFYPHQESFKKLYLKERSLLDKIHQLDHEKSELLQSRKRLFADIKRITNKQEKIKAYLHDS